MDHTHIYANIDDIILMDRCELTLYMDRKYAIFTMNLEIEVKCLKTGSITKTKVRGPANRPRVFSPFGGGGGGLAGRIFQAAYLEWEGKSRWPGGDLERSW